MTTPADEDDVCRRWRLTAVSIRFAAGSQPPRTGRLLVEVAAYLDRSAQGRAISLAEGREPGGNLHAHYFTNAWNGGAR